MKLIARLLVNGLAVFISAYLIPGIYVKDFLSAVVISIVLGLLNIFIKPIFVFLTLPLTILTLGLFQLVINGLMILLVSYLVPGFVVSGFMSAVLFSLVVSLISWFLRTLAKD